MNKTTIRWMLGSCARAVFGQRTLTRKGEAGVPFRFRPGENPRLLIGATRVDPEMRRQWSRLLNTDEVIFDIGAHIGLTVQRFYSVLDGKCQLWAFEPNPRNFELLEANVRALGSDRVHLIKSAVGDCDGMATFCDNAQHGAISRLSQTRAAGSYQSSLYWKNYEEITVEVIRLDSFLDKHTDVHPTFLKIDVEGAAVMVLKGAWALLERYRPGIYCEFHGADEQEGTCRILEAAGYQGIRFAVDGHMTWCAPQECAGYFLHPGDPKVPRLHLA